MDGTSEKRRESYQEIGINDPHINLIKDDKMLVRWWEIEVKTTDFYINLFFSSVYCFNF